MKAPRHPCVPFGGSKLPFPGFADCDDSSSDWPPAFRNKRGTPEKEEKIQKISEISFGTEHLMENSPAGIELVAMTYDDYPVEASRDDAHKEQEFPEFLGALSHWQRSESVGDPQATSLEELKTESLDGTTTTTTTTTALDRILTRAHRAAQLYRACPYQASPLSTRLAWCLMQWQRGAQGSDPIDIPVWNGEPSTFQDFEYDVLLYRDATIEKDRGVVGPRIARKMTGRARDAIIGMTVTERTALQQPDGATFLPALDVGKYLERYFFNLRRERGGTMTGYIQREQNTHSDLGRAIGRMTTANAAGPATATTPTDAAPHAGMPVPDTPSPAAAAAEPAADAPAAPADGVLVAPPPAFPISTPVRATGADDALGTGPPSVDMLPDGVRSWLLLRRSGLPTQSRTTLIGHLDGRYMMSRVTRRLRESFDDADLREIDQGRPPV